MRYRDFDIKYDPPPIPDRSCDWVATHEDFDPTPVYLDDPPADNRQFYGRSLDEVKAEIDAWYEEQEE